MLTNDRMVLGVGVSPWPEDYEITRPFAPRGKRMDEGIAVVRGLMDGGYFEYHGDFYDMPSIKMSPSPAKRVPIMIGGHPEAALRRAARCDGWLHGGGDPDDLHGLLDRLTELPRRGRHENDPFEVHVI